jgi:CO dehydrogenase nickel-insertion accessory protein CooC1
MERAMQQNGEQMIIAVASGKGGTGKTTVAVNLALSLSNVQLMDCDVEENTTLLLLCRKKKSWCFRNFATAVGYVPWYARKMRSARNQGRSAL